MESLSLAANSSCIDCIVEIVNSRAGRLELAHCDRNALMVVPCAWCARSVPWSRRPDHGTVGTVRALALGWPGFLEFKPVPSRLRRINLWNVSFSGDQSTRKSTRQRSARKAKEARKEKIHSSVLQWAA
ncbi:uncharacterized protein LOC144660273 [Oculina patagonica]